MYFLLFHTEEMILFKLFKLCNSATPGLHVSTALDPVAFGDKTNALQNCDKGTSLLLVLPPLKWIVSPPRPSWSGLSDHCWLLSLSSGVSAEWALRVLFVQYILFAWEQYPPPLLSF